MTDRTLPNADRATKTDITFSARAPNMLPKKAAATVWPEDRNCSFGTAAKYAMLHSMYMIPTEMMAMGAAIFRVRVGFFVSLKACTQQY